MIKVLLVDDHELVRVGIRRLLEDAPGIKVCCEASSGEDAVQEVGRKKPDVVLMDLNMPGIGGMEATRKLAKQFPDVPVIIVTMHADDPYPSRLMQAGARGYITKGATVEEMLAAIRAVIDGGRYISPGVAQALALAGTGHGSGESPFGTLSERELQVLFMIVDGDKIQEMAAKLHVSPKTVSTYRTRMFKKLGVRNDSALIRLAMRYGLVEDMGCGP